MQRRLTTIVAADVTGYSRLIGLDEEGTLAALRTHRAELIDPHLEQHGGRIANTAGDSLLIEFPSAVEAVRCAIAVQQGMNGRNADAPDDRKIEFRVGINVGDVVDQDGDLLGDGVNIAARLEAQAPPGGIVLSRAARDQIRDRLDVDLADLGEIEVKNIARPVRAFQVAGEGVSAAPVRSSSRRGFLIAALAVVLVALLAVGTYWWTGQPEFTPADPAKMAYPLEDRPSIAVLAFDNLTGDPEQEHVSDGISEDIISKLARLPGIVVIARNSSFSYKGKPIDIRQIAEEMSVRYVLTGSLQQSDKTLRVSAQLINAVSGHHVWSQKFDRPRADFFEVRDQITKQIIAELNIEVVEGNTYVGRASLFESVDAWLLARRVIWHSRRFNSTDNRIAIGLDNEILAMEPDSIWAFDSLAWRHSTEAHFRWSDDPAESLRQAETYAKKALVQDDTYPGGHLALSWIRSIQQRNEEAIELGERALALAPNDPGIMAVLALILQKDMQAKRAIELFERAVRVDRKAQGWVWENYGEALLMVGRYADAVPIYRAALKTAKGISAAESHLGLAVALDALGQEKKARTEVEVAVETVPSLTVSYLRDFQRYKDEDYKERYLATLARLGLPEE